MISKDSLKRFFFTRCYLMFIILHGNVASTTTWPHKSRNQLLTCSSSKYGKWSSQKASDLEAPATRPKASHHRNRPPATANLWCCYHCCLPNYNPKWCSFYLGYRYYQSHLRHFFKLVFQSQLPEMFWGDHPILLIETNHVQVPICVM